uniref:Solute carrier family 2, facilitated glucose transporter member 1-like n=1 Tax=Phallusia mammillata TaxID=59560 RepID=A0A6F9DTK5_9ASCI|nr:solute carrier family 2, facilitated glucose transporter member 1-like [Phallusia mammillata]
MSRINSNFCVFLIVLNHATIFIPMGLNLVALNPSTPAIEVFVNETFQLRYNTTSTVDENTLIVTLAQSMLVVGAAMGSISTHLWAKYFRRRTGVIIVHLLSLSSAILMSIIAYLFHSYEALIIGRWVNGLARGLGFSLGPLYVAEITSRKTLGFYQSPLGWIVQLSAVLGNIIAHPNVLGGVFTWPYAMAIPGLFSVLYLCFVPWIPDTIPHHLNVEKSTGVEIDGENPMTRRSFLLLEKLRSEKGPGLIKEYEDIQSEIAADNRVEGASLRTILTIGTYRRQVIAAIVVQFSLQASGIQAVMQYTNNIFESAGVHPGNSTYYTIGTLILMGLAVFASTGLLTRFGTKRMLVIGLTIVVCALTLLTISTTNSSDSSNILGVISVALFAIGVGTGPMLTMVTYPSELTTVVSRPNAMWLASVVFWVTGGLVSFIFPYSLELLGGYAYIPFTVLVMLSGGYVIFFLPETRNRSAQDIKSFFAKSKLSMSNKASSKQSTELLPADLISKTDEL